MITVTHEVACDACKTPIGAPWRHTAQANCEFPQPPQQVYDFRIRSVSHILCEACAAPLVKLLGELYAGGDPQLMLTRNGYVFVEGTGHWVKRT